MSMDITAVYDELFRDKSFLLEGFTGMGVFCCEPGEDARRIVFCNEVYASLSGWSRAELMQLDDVNAMQISESEDLPVWRQLMNAENGEPFGGTFAWVHPDGSASTVEHISLPIQREGVLYVFEFVRPLSAPNLYLHFN